jgi:hypothetical protein
VTCTSGGPCPVIKGDTQCPVCARPVPVQPAPPPRVKYVKPGTRKHDRRNGGINGR